MNVYIKSFCELQIHATHIWTLHWRFRNRTEFVSGWKIAGILIGAIILCALVLLSLCPCFNIINKKGETFLKLRLSFLGLCSLPKKFNVPISRTNVCNQISFYWLINTPFGCVEFIIIVGTFKFDSNLSNHKQLRHNENALIGFVVCFRVMSLKLFRIIYTLVFNVVVFFFLFLFVNKTERVFTPFPILQ